jgi:hypothetical protein
LDAGVVFGVTDEGNTADITRRIIPIDFRTKCVASGQGRVTTAITEPDENTVQISMARAAAANFGDAN